MSIDGARRASLRRLAGLAGVALGAGTGPLRAAVGEVDLHVDDALAAYGFPAPHPFSVARQGWFLAAAREAGLLSACTLRGAREATLGELRRFHDSAYIARVAGAERAGLELLDDGDTPVFAGIQRAASCVVGTALAGLERILAGEARRSLQPIGGLHHAARDHAAGFCVYNDLGVLLASLRGRHGIDRVAYVDIDAHHGDGVFYAFEDDPGVIVADVHQDSRTLFPGSGRADERGRGAALGTKLNVELAPRSGDAEFLRAWDAVEAHLDAHAPQFFVLQCGVDSLAGDPLAQLDYSPAVHAHVTRRLRVLAERHARGRLMCFGGGGYARTNVARGWCAVLAALLA